MNNIVFSFFLITVIHLEEAIDINFPVIINLKQINTDEDEPSILRRRPDLDEDEIPILGTWSDQDEDEIPILRIGPDPDEDKIPILRTADDHHDDHSHKKKKYKLEKQSIKKLQKFNESMNLQRQKHLQKVKFVIDHLTDHYLSCLYIYKEVQRIKSEGKIMNAAREIVKRFDFLHVHGGKLDQQARDAFVDCFKSFRTIPTAPPWFQEQVPNKLTINIVKDPYNDGVE